MSNFDPCDFLFSRWKNLALWRNLWTILLFLLGAAFTIFLIGAVLLFIRESWIPAALSTLGTLANGVAVGWILARRNQAVREETEAKKELLQHCGPAVPTTARSLAAGGPTKSAPEMVKEVEKQLTLFGKIR